MFDLHGAKRGRVHVCGHRGHSIAAPENTMAAFEMTRELGGTACEIDVVLSEDGEIVVLHDSAVDRTTDGSGLAASMSAAAITQLDAGSWFSDRFAGERVPLLRDVFAWAKETDIGLNVEIKEQFDEDALIARLATLLGETGAMDWMVAISFDHQQLVKVKERIAGVRTEGITHARHVDPARLVTDARLDSVSVELGRFRPEDGAAIHHAGVAIRYHLPVPEKIAKAEALGWDVSGRVGSMLEAGLIDSVSGDDVGYLRALVDAHPVAATSHT